MTNGLPVLAPELSHLSDEQIEHLYERYLGTEKIKDLLIEYKISCPQSKLVRLIPPKLLSDQSCTQCGSEVYELRMAKTSKAGPAGIKCFSCDHIENSIYACSCKVCEAKRAQVLLDLKQQKIDKQRAIRSKINEQYNLDDKSPLHIDELSFRSKVLLFSLMRSLSDQALEKIEPLSSEFQGVPLASSKDKSVDIIRELYRSGIIRVDPESPVTAFIAEEDYGSFYVQEVNWVVNVTLVRLSSVRSSQADVYRILGKLLEGEMPAAACNDLFDLIFDISLDEVICGLNYWLTFYKLPFSIGAKTKEVIRALLPDYTVSQLCFFAKCAVEEACLYEIQSKVPKKQAANIIPSNMLDRGVKNRGVKHNYKSYPRPKSMVRTHLSRVIFDHILGTADGGFTMLPSEHEIRVFKDEMDGDDSNCSKCGGFLSTASDDDGWVERLCTQCGFVFD